MNKSDINAKLKEQGRSKVWLQKQLNMPQSTFYWKLDNGFKPEEVEKIESILGVK